MLDGDVHGMLVLGENPAVGSANSGLHRRAMAALDWMVVRDLVETETATFWSTPRPRWRPASSARRTSEPRCSSCPRPRTPRRTGSFTNTQRLLQWRHKAVEPPGDCRSELWFTYHLGRIIREKLAASTDPMDEPVQRLQWHYPTSGATADPSADAVLREINGWGPDGSALSAYTELKDDGSTACGCWIYCGCYADETNQPARRTPGSEQSWVAPEWGWAWPANRRILYNRASADPAGRPWSERKRYVWWDEERASWTGEDVPDFVPDKRPDYVPPDGARAQDAIAGDTPFIMQVDGRGWLFAPSGVVDGPLPTHYEPHESPVENPLYAQEWNPARQRFDRPGNRSNGPGDRDAFPFVLTTYRLTEHHTAGGMSRFLPVSVRAAAGDVLRGQPGAGGRATARARRLGDHHQPAGRDRGAGAGHRRISRCLLGRTSCTRSGCRTTGARTACRAETRPTTCSRSCSTPTCTSRRSKAATCDIRPGGGGTSA